MNRHVQLGLAAAAGMPQTLDTPIQRLALDELTRIVNGERGFPSLLSTSVKTEKGEKQGILTGVCYLAASNASGSVNVCPFATAGCIHACLGHTSGRMRFSSQQIAQVLRTWLLRGKPALFRSTMDRELLNLYARAQKRGMRAFARLNGTSDLPVSTLSTIPGSDKNPGIQFYDYTKDNRRAERWALERPADYHLTFSRSEKNHADCLRLLSLGVNVAIVSTLPRPETYEGFPTLDGDETDARPTDTRGAWVWLSTKGPVAKRDSSGFVVHV